MAAAYPRLRPTIAADWCGGERGRQHDAKWIQKLNGVAHKVCQACGRLLAIERRHAAES